MYFSSLQNFATLVILSASSVFATPLANPDALPNLQTRDAASDQPTKLTYWTEKSFGGTPNYEGESAERAGKGDCQFMLSDIAGSAKAPVGYKCTLYSVGNCHGDRTREFNHIEGIADMGGKMNKNAQSWRCCKIGTTNYWGYCDAKLNGGS